MRPEASTSNEAALPIPDAAPPHSDGLWHTAHCPNGCGWRDTVGGGPHCGLYATQLWPDRGQGVARPGICQRISAMILERRQKWWEYAAQY